MTGGLLPSDRLLLDDGERAQAYVERQTHWRYWNIVTAIRRRERRLKRSMAHTPKPRPGDMVRWRGMAKEIGELRGKAEAMRPGHPAHQFSEDGHAST